jgi:AAA domain-containing protein
MPFNKMSKTAFPPRQWALVGYPGDGKSTFATQMRAPLLPIDADHRFTEVAHHAAGEVYELSDNPADNVDAEKIAAALKKNMGGSDVKTVIVDSLTSILTPLVVQAILDNDAGRNKNRVASFKNKSLSMRLLQDTITGWGVDTLWVYHLRSGMDGQAREQESTSISPVELARLRRSLNMTLRVVKDGEKRGIKVDWARRGRSGMTIWDDSGRWLGFPERIEQAVYGGLTVEDMERIESQTPTAFASADEAIGWGLEQGCFRDSMHSKNAYDECKREKQPKTAADMWRLWIEEVKNRVAEQATPVAA